MKIDQSMTLEDGVLPLLKILNDERNTEIETEVNNHAN